jgi:nucleoside-diphosphate-sugar epimerase
VADAFDSAALHKELSAVKPEVVVHLLTDLPFGTPAAQMAEGTVRNAKMRRDGTRNLVDAARACGVLRILAASIAWVYAPGREPHVEDDPLNLDVPEPAKTTMLGVAELEDRVLHSPPMTGVVLRYGHLYGPGTGHDTRDDALSIHVDDAARAALLGLDSDVEGIFNIVDDNDRVSNEKARSKLTWRPQARAAP